MKKHSVKHISYFLLPAAIMSLILSSCTTQFGSLPEGEYISVLEKSPNYHNGEFKNIEETPMMSGDKG